MRARFAEVGSMRVAGAEAAGNVRPGNVSSSSHSIRTVRRAHLNSGRAKWVSKGLTGGLGNGVNGYGVGLILLGANYGKWSNLK